MTDIRDYPNPLFKEFISFISGVYEDNGTYSLPNGKVSFETLLEFIDGALENPENLQRLNVDGTVTRATVKALCEGKTGDVWNSILVD